MKHYQEVFNELVNLVERSYYCGYNVSYEQHSLMPLKVTGTHIISESMVNNINKIAIKYDLAWFIWVNENNDPEIRIYEDENE